MCYTSLLCVCLLFFDCLPGFAIIVCVCSRALHAVVTHTSFAPLAGTTVSVEASFNDTRCDGEMVCPNDPLLFTCTVTGSPVVKATIKLPFQQDVDIHFDNTTSGELPHGVTVQFHDAIINNGLANYTLSIAFERALLLTGIITCDPRTFQPLSEEGTCSVATGI